MERGPQLAEHVEDADAREKVLTDQLDLLDALAKEEGWRETPQFEGCVRKITREFHLAALLEARTKYNLRDDNVKECWDALWKKFPPHPDEPPDGE